MPDERKERGLSGRMLLHGGKRGRSLLRDRGFFGGWKSAPGRPTQAQHLVQDAIAFGSEGDCRYFRGDLRSGLMSRRHVNLSLSPKEILYAGGKASTTSSSVL